MDQYGDFLVLQFLTAGAERWRNEIVDGLTEITGIENVYERSDVDVRKLEGLDERTGVVKRQRTA